LPNFSGIAIGNRAHEENLACEEHSTCTDEAEG